MDNVSQAVIADLLNPDNAVKYAEEQFKQGNFVYDCENNCSLVIPYAPSGYVGIRAVYRLKTRDKKLYLVIEDKEIDITKRWHTFSVTLALAMLERKLIEMVCGIYSDGVETNPRALLVVSLRSGKACVFDAEEIAQMCRHHFKLDDKPIVRHDLIEGLYNLINRHVCLLTTEGSTISICSTAVQSIEYIPPDKL